ncbi:unnamed protein product [Coccothraustes coccothraustes]
MVKYKEDVAFKDRKAPQIALAASADIVECIPWLNWTGWCSCSGRLEGRRKMCCDMSCRTFPLGVQKGSMESQDMYAGNEDTVEDAAFLGEARSAELQWFASVFLHAAS